MPFRISTSAAGPPVEAPMARARHEAVDAEREHVGPETLAELDRLLAVFRLADHLEPGIGREHLDEALAHGERVLDHENADPRHGYPASSRMRSRSRPWSNSLLAM